MVVGGGWWLGDAGSSRWLIVSTAVITVMNFGNETNCSEISCDTFVVSSSLLRDFKSACGHPP